MELSLRVLLGERYARVTTNVLARLVRGVRLVHWAALAKWSSLSYPRRNSPLVMR